MSESDQALLRRIDAYLDAMPRRESDVARIGPFTLYFRRGAPIPELSYARPSGPLSGDLCNEITQVRAAFAGRGLVCRWEFLCELFPDFPEILLQNGFPTPTPRPLMVVTREAFRPESSAVAEIRPIEREEIGAVSQVVNEAFGGPADLEGLATYLEGAMGRGVTVYAAFVEGKPVAGGCHTPLGATTEVAGIGTLPAFRRRGIAGALTAALVADAFERGCECVFLSAADATVQRVYARVGFALVGTAMDTADSPPPPAL